MLGVSAQCLAELLCRELLSEYQLPVEAFLAAEAFNLDVPLDDHGSGS